LQKKVLDGTLEFAEAVLSKVGLVELRGSGPVRQDGDESLLDGIEEEDLVRGSSREREIVCDDDDRGVLVSRLFDEEPGE
jgi:hypothetical protein